MNSPGPDDRERLYAAFSAGRHAEAEALARQSIAAWPGYADAWKALGTILGMAGRADEAIPYLKEAIRLSPLDSESHNNMGTALLQKGDAAGAETSYREALRAAPDNLDAACNLASLLRQTARMKEAAEYYRHALTLRPEAPGVLNDFGNVLTELSQFEEAETCYRKALKLKPEYPAASLNLANVLRDIGRLGEAEGYYQRAIRLDPGSAAAHNNLGALYRDLGRLSDAEACHREAFRINPRYQEAYNNLGNVLADLGRALEAEACFRKALELKPDYSNAFSNLLFLYAYFGMVAPAEYLRAAQSWEVCTVPADARHSARCRTFSRTPRTGRPLRVGYVSGDFGEHAVGYFLQPVFDAHDRKRVDVHAYSTFERSDPVAARLRAKAGHWSVIAGVSDEEATELIIRDRIDVLVDLSGHTSHGRLGIFARRAAPVQCHYLGYFASTGLSEMDYLIGDSVLIPEQHDSQYRERVWRTPGVWVSYKPPHALPEVRWEPDPAGKVCLGSFNHLGKMTPQTVALWAQALHRIPNAVLLLKTKELNEPSNRERVIAQFADHGIAGPRIELHGRMPDWKAHMAFYGRVDVALNPVGGHGGATTTCEALLMGVPVVSMAGSRFGERMTSSMLTAIGCQDWIADSEENYIEKVQKLLASHLHRLQLRTSLRQRTLSSPLCDSKRIARELEDSYEAMFDRWFSHHA